MRMAERNASAQCNHMTMSPCNQRAILRNQILQCIPPYNLNPYDVIPRRNSHDAISRCDAIRTKRRRDPIRTIQVARCSPHGAIRTTIRTMQSHNAIPRWNPHDSICTMQSDEIRTMQSNVNSTGVQ